MEPKEQILYIQPDDITAALNEDVEKTVVDFFNLKQEERQFVVIQELLQNLYTYSQTYLNPSTTSVLFTVLVDVHNHNVSQNAITMQQLTSFAATQLSKYGIEIPPLYHAILTQKQIMQCSDFMDTYLVNYKLYRYLFKPVNVIKVVTQHEIEVVSVVDRQQLGYNPDTENMLATAKKQPAKPASASNTRTVASPPSRPFNITVLPLREAQLYVPPQPKTEEQLRDEEIQREVDAIKEEPPKTDEEATEEHKVDVERFSKVIELQVQQEVEKLRQKIQSDLADPKKKK